MTPEQVEEFFADLRQAEIGTRIKFHLQDSNTVIEGTIIDPPGEYPSGLEDGVFLQDVDDYNQVYCLCPDKANGVGNILVHTFVQAPAAQERGPSPEYEDDISQRLKTATQVTVGGGAIHALSGQVSGVVDTNAPPPPPPAAG